MELLKRQVIEAFTVAAMVKYVPPEISKLVSSVWFPDSNSKVALAEERVELEMNC